MRDYFLAPSPSPSSRARRAGRVQQATDELCWRHPDGAGTRIARQLQAERAPYPGRGKRTGDTLEFRFDDPDGSRTWNTYKYDRTTDTWTSLIQNQARGKDRTFFAEETYRRR